MIMIPSKDANSVLLDKEHVPEQQTPEVAALVTNPEISRSGQSHSSPVAVPLGPAGVFLNTDVRQTV